jgi:hypothetical protein
MGQAQLQSHLNGVSGLCRDLGPVNVYAYATHYPDAPVAEDLEYEFVDA